MLAHPSFGVTKVYIAKVEGRVTRPDDRAADAGRSSSTTARSPPTRPGCSTSSAGSRRGGRDRLVELTLHSGRNRIVRRMMAEVGHPVLELVRRQFGPLHLGTLPVGKARELTKVERGALLTLSRQEPADDEAQEDSRQEAE